jgi:hypothetical protein
MCTCSYENVKAYPADMLLDLITRRAMGGVRIARGGSKDVSRKGERRGREGGNDDFLITLI